MKVCTCCGEEKIFNDFSKHKSCKDGLQSVCKKCACEQAKARYHEQKKSKLCSMCGVRKNLDEFNKAWSNGDGYRSKCKTCTNEKSQEKRNADKKQKETVKNKKSKKLIKEFQLDAMKQFGNTIVAKKITPDVIIEEFKKEGFDVKVREFTTNGNGYTKDSHYVVSVLGKE